ncbi:neural cell adhesion molecule 1-like [Pomacea canaliculata]|uniref:neural cell adhesion molecule 1-like n=1 Tax=Pomacea canaliculata TaxID=400727 RepID=UPI000D726AEB|nr:neural cell adhesion molecule 1-like [Pomacea canaliculata]
MTRLLCMDAARFIGLALQSAAMSGFVAVMFMFPLCAGQSWEVEIHSKNEKYTFDVTQDNAVVSLQCSLGNTSSPSLEWYDGQGKIISDIHSGDSIPRRIVIRRRNFVELRFLAPETELNSGNYTCRGSGADGVVKEKTIQIILYKGIQLTSPTRQFAMYGQDARLNCSSSASFPRETNLFFSNWTALAGARYRKEYDYVIIANFSRADEGMYRCSIRLHEIKDSKEYELHLLAAVPPKFNGSMTFWPPEPKVGQNLKIMCDISAKPDPVYQFYKVEGNNTRIIQSNDVTNGTLLLKNLTQADDGEYMCVATNGWGSASQTISIDVLSPLTIRYARVDLNNKLEGSEGRLKCNVTGDPEPVVSWKRGNYYFHNQSKSEISGRIYTNTERVTDKNKGLKSVVHTLIFRSLEASDMSTYTCEASNMFARVNSTVPLVVQFKPNFSKQMTTRFILETHQCYSNMHSHWKP